MGIDGAAGGMSSVEAIAAMPGPLQAAMVESLAPLLALAAEAEAQLAELAANEEAHREALKSATDDMALLEARLATIEAELVASRERVGELESQMASIEVHAGHALHTAKGEFGAFLTGPMSVLLADAITLVGQGPDYLPAVREKLEDMEDEMRRAAE